jgi:hypothetical protein
MAGAAHASSAVAHAAAAQEAAAQLSAQHSDFVDKLIEQEVRRTTDLDNLNPWIKTCPQSKTKKSMNNLSRSSSAQRPAFPAYSGFLFLHKTFSKIPYFDPPSPPNELREAA